MRDPDFDFTQIRSDAKSQGTLLPEGHPYVQLVKRIGSRIAQKASNASGISGQIEHMKVRYMKNCVLLLSAEVGPFA